MPVSVSELPPSGSLAVTLPTWLLFLRSFIVHSVVCRTTAPQPPPKRVLHGVRSNASSFNCQHPLVSLRSPSSCLHLIPRVPVAYNLLCTYVSVTCFRQLLPRKKWPIKWNFFLFIVCKIFLSSWYHVILLNFSNDRFKWCSPSFSSTIFQNIPGISYLLSKVSKFQRHRKLYSKCSKWKSALFR